MIAQGGPDEIRRRAAVDGGRLEDAFLALTEGEEAGD
jgi:hypothetical protein